jgi:hypothetical protein
LVPSSIPYNHWFGACIYAPFLFVVDTSALTMAFQSSNRNEAL